MSRISVYVNKLNKEDVSISFFELEEYLTKHFFVKLTDEILRCKGFTRFKEYADKNGISTSALSSMVTGRYSSPKRIEVVSMTSKRLYVKDVDYHKEINLDSLTIVPDVSSNSSIDNRLSIGDTIIQLSSAMDKVENLYKSGEISKKVMAQAKRKSMECINEIMKEAKNIKKD